MNLPKKHPSNQSVYPKVTPISPQETRPFWSVMIPTYNNFNYLAQTLRSILEQDPGPEQMQIAVIDDASVKDDPEPMVREIGKNRVDFYRQPQNLGINGNWNACLQLARGYWVHILHQDDRVLPGFYARFQETLANKPEIGAAFCRNIYMDELGNWQYFSPLESTSAGILDNWLEKIAISCCVMCPAMVVKRQVYEEIGGFHRELNYALDWEMWQRIATYYPIWYEPEPLACYRLHSASTSYGMFRSGANIADLYKTLEICQSYLPENIVSKCLEKAKEHQADFAFHLAKGLLAQGEITAALSQIREGLKGCQTANTLRNFAALLTLPESESVLRIFTSFLVSTPPEKLLESVSLPANFFLPEDIHLNDVNLIIFPDWNQGEEVLYQELGLILKILITHPDKKHLALLVDTGILSKQDAMLAISGILMSIFLEENLEEIEEPEIYFVENLDKIQWQVLQSSLHWRIVLSHENTPAILAAAEHLPCCEVETLVDKRAVQIGSRWHF